MIVDKNRKTARKISGKALIVILIAACLSLPIISDVELIHYAGAKPAFNEGRIAFTRYEDGRRCIWIMDADGKNEEKLTSGPNDMEPDWSPDGAKIAFSSGQIDIHFPLLARKGSMNIYIMNADGSNLRQITNSPECDRCPTWSPDGKYIAFSRAVWEVKDGKEIRKSSDIYVMDVDGSNLKKLTESPMGAKAGCFSNPDWSPDGSKIAFEERDLQFPETRAPQVWVMDADGSNQKILNDWGDQPAWSPDGKSIAFRSTRAGWAIWRSNDIYIMDSNGANARIITTPDINDEEWPTWSPDGAKIAYGCMPEGPDIYVMNADGSNARMLTMTPLGQERFPDWCWELLYVLEPAGKLRTTWGKIKHDLLLRSE